MNARLREAAGAALAIGVLYALSIAVGFALLCLAFKAGLLAQIDILFYRGLVLIAVVAAATFALGLLALRRWRRPDLSGRDAFAATMVSLAFNLSFLVVLPVTVDRSISLFMLGQMANRSDRQLTGEEMTRLFTDIYIGEHRQIERRLREQTLSGFVDKTGDTYRISAKGRALVAVSKIVAGLFDSHAGLVDASPARRQAAAATAPEKH